MKFISREQVLTALHYMNAPSDLVAVIKQIPSFPAPNPEMLDGRNVMGQTEEQFWNAVEAQEK